MRFASLGSGSRGNALVVESGGTRVLLDCGFGIRETVRRLERLGIEAESLSAILVTHEHSDHIGGVFKFARRHSIPVWLTHGTLVAAPQRDTELPESDRRLRTERGFSREDLTGREIAGKTIGLVGIGNIGRRVAALAHAFGLQVLAVDPNLSSDEIRLRGAEPVSLDTLLERSDFVSLHCPRDATTRGMIDAAAFARMKPGSVFISTARGGIHDERGLHQAIVSGRVAGAGLDVWDQEPPPLDHPLLACDTVVATYHTAGVTHEARRNMAAISADQLVRLLRGERPPRLINPEVWPAYVKRFETILQRPVVDHG